MRNTKIKNNLHKELNYKLVREIVVKHLGEGVFKNIHTRRRDKVEKRQFAMYVLYSYTKHSLHQVAKEFDRDHATVLHSCRKMAGILTYDKVFMDMMAKMHTDIMKHISSPTHNLKEAKKHLDFCISFLSNAQTFYIEKELLSKTKRMSSILKSISKQVKQEEYEQLCITKQEDTSVGVV